MFSFCRRYPIGYHAKKYDMPHLPVDFSSSRLDSAIIPNKKGHAMVGLSVQMI
jgi:hypothetical protein